MQRHAPLARSSPAPHAGVGGSAAGASTFDVDRLAAAGSQIWRAIAALGGSRAAAPLGLALLLGATLYNVRNGSRFGGVDFQSFYGAAQDVRAGRDPYGAALSFVHGYSPALGGPLFATKAFVYAPVFGVLFLPLTLLSGPGALAVWDALEILFVVGAVYAAMRIAGIRPRAGTVLLLAGAAALTQPMHKEWFLGQTDVFITFVVACSVWARQTRRPVAAGLLLGLACAVKPALALLLPFLLWKREFRYALVGAATTITLYAAPLLALPSGTWHDQLTVWRFWSNQFIAFVHNDSPDGVFVRLFTGNPVVRPLHVAPALATVLWLAVVAAVAVSCAAVIRRAPLGRDTASLLEVGLVVEAVLLVTPLTEWPYLVLLTIPLVGVLCWCREQGPTRQGLLAMLGALAVWFMLCGPAGIVEYRLDDRFAGHSVLADVAVVLAPIYLYTLIGAFVLQLHLVARARDVRILPAIRATVVGAPGLLVARLAGAHRRP